MDINAIKNHVENVNKLIEYIDENKDVLKSIGITSFVMTLDYNYLITWENLYISYFTEINGKTKFLGTEELMKILENLSDNKEDHILIFKNINDLCRKINNASLFSNFDIEDYSDPPMSTLSGKRIHFRNDYKEKMEGILILDGLRGMLEKACNYDELSNNLISINKSKSVKTKV